MKTWFEKNNILTLVAVNIVIMVFLITLLELLLRTFYPAGIALFALPSTHNGLQYGYGYGPNQLVKVSNPDSCEVYTDRTNSHGWRDLDRNYENIKQAYRILVLGDSQTFGFIVPAEKTYTRILEKKLQDTGYNVEIISIALYGWGTDQELEALVNEGLLYKPNLIIVQFSANDLMDNAYFYLATKLGTKIPEKNKGYKPFYYELNDSNELVRRDNPYFKRPWTLGFLASSGFVKFCINNSEVLKRLYQLYQFSHNYSSCDTTYKIGKKQLDQFQFLLNLDWSSPLCLSLQERLDSRVSSEELDFLLRAENDQTKKIGFKVFEDRLHHHYWLREKYVPKQLDKNSYEWRLFVAIIRKMKQLADTIPADLVIFPATDETEFMWHASWFCCPDTLEAKENCLSPIRAIREIMPHIGIKVVNNAHVYHRARNDSHANIEGNESMAQDLYEFLITNYGLDKFYRVVD